MLPAEDVYTKESGKKVAPKDSVLIFKKLNNQWTQQASIYPDDYINESLLDILFTKNLRLLKMNKGDQFVRVPGWGSPTYQILKTNGQVINEYPIPHPLASSMPRDAKEKISRFRQNPPLGQVLTDTGIDNQGTLYFLLGNLSREENGEPIEYSGRLILATKPGSNAYKSYLLNTAIRRFTLNPAGTGAYAVSAEDEDLVFIKF